MQMMFSSLGVMGLISAFLLLRADRVYKTGLQLPSREAQA
jgi:hypothetical protein